MIFPSGVSVGCSPAKGTGAISLVRGDLSWTEEAEQVDPKHQPGPKVALVACNVGQVAHRPTQVGERLLAVKQAGVTGETVLRDCQQGLSKPAGGR
jgi:hypothetical protein